MPCKQCIHPDCIKRSSFNILSKNKPEYCADHKLEEMIDVISKTCIHEGCTSNAKGKTNQCVKHGGGKRCNEPDCKTSALGKTDKCAAHGGGKRCNEPECKALCPMQIR